MSNQQNLPERLYIHEQGTWEPTSTNPDDDMFVPTGLWEARDYNGTPYHTAAQDLGIERWLVDNGYRDTGDGIHYQSEVEHMQTQEIDLEQTRDQDEHEGEYFCGVCGWVSITLFPNCHATQESEA